MNLFDYRAAGDFMISHQFWIFVVIAVPLTVLTVGSWWFSRRRQQAKEMNRARNLVF
ncbi:hypothetical protein BJX61DRAFT_512781 [Aspergillus egyptiacus]|nr:hypothetical protein BJX61DRAFT_512781 [Aspergillus egyptiacus]